MLLRTHLAAGVLAGLMLEPTGLSSASRFLYFAIVSVATILPDIDHRNSKIGHEFPRISRAVNSLFGHRGIFHAIALPAALWYVLSEYWAGYAGIAALIGILTHLACDCLTKEGVPLLYPLTDKRLRGFVTTGSGTEKAVFALILCAIAIKVF